MYYITCKNEYALVSHVNTTPTHVAILEEIIDVTYIRQDVRTYSLQRDSNAEPYRYSVGLPKGAIGDTKPRDFLVQAVAFCVVIAAVWGLVAAVEVIYHLPQVRVA